MSGLFVPQKRLHIPVLIPTSYCGLPSDGSSLSPLNAKDVILKGRSFQSMALIYSYHNSGHCPLSIYLKHRGSEIGFYLRLQVDSTQLGPIDRGSL
jgi:hypothetical protein